MLDALKLDAAQIAKLDAAIAEGEALQVKAARSLLRSLADEGAPANFEDVRRRASLLGEIERDVRELRRIRSIGCVIVPEGKERSGE